MIKRNGTWEQVCHGSVCGDMGKFPSDVDHGRETSKKMEELVTKYVQASQRAGTKLIEDQFYKTIADHLYIQYGPAFQSLKNICVSAVGEATALVESYVGTCSLHAIHPTTLDGIFQLSFATLYGTVSSNFPTMVPKRLGRLWISIGEDLLGTESIARPVHSRTNVLSSRTVVASSMVFGHQDTDLKIHVEELGLMAISSPSESKTIDEAEHISHFISWNVDLDRLSLEEVKIYLEEARGTTSEPREWSISMDLLLFSFAAVSLKEIKESSRSVTPALQQYALWLQERLDDFLSSAAESGITARLHDEDHRRSLYDKVLPTAVAKLYILLGENLTSMLLGDIDPLALLFEDETLMVDFYTDLFYGSTAIGPISRYLEALVHKWPALDFLEVGAGTGASSAKFLDIMHNEASDTRFQSYTFTDISPSFFEKAQIRLKAHEDRATYKVLNIEEDVALQGFSEKQYDIIIAGNVLHATADLSKCLQNLKQLLKPGGRIFIKEMTTSMRAIIGFFSGLLPGWWRAVEDERVAHRSPVLSEGQWDTILQNNGFSGSDLVLRDFVDTRCFCWSFIVSTIPKSGTSDTDICHDNTSRESPVIILDPKSQLQQHAAKTLVQNLGIPPTNLLSPDEVFSRVSPCKQPYIIVISLDELLLWDLQSFFLKALQYISANASRILWVTGGGGRALKSPKYGIAHGLLRVIRQENSHLDLVSVSLDISPSQERLESSSLCDITNVFLAHDQETEYWDIDGRLSISRLVTARKVDKHIFSKLAHPIVMQDIAEKDLKLQVKVPGLLDTIEFQEVANINKPLGPDEVVIEVRTLGVNFKDCLTMLGRVNSDVMGSECAGIIVQAGDNTGLSVGDRVVTAALDSYRTVLRTRKEIVVKIPDWMSFIEAASFPIAFCTALYSLIYVARLQKHESVLIHAASGGTGQAAVQIALRAGAEVFATVGSRHKKTLLMERYGISENHILYSRDSSFADGVLRLTKGVGVDVVLNSISGRLLESTWNIVAPFGRFVEIGRKDVDTHGYLPMYPFIKNLSFSGVDLTMVLEKNLQLGRRLLREVMDLARRKEILSVYPIQSYGIVEAEKAFRFMQSGKSSGKIVLEIEKSHVVPVSFFVEIPMQAILTSHFRKYGHTLTSTCFLEIAHT